MFVCEVYASIRRCVMLALYKGVHKHGRGPGIREENSPNLLESMQLWMYVWDRLFMGEARGRCGRREDAADVVVCGFVVYIRF